MKRKRYSVEQIAAAVRQHELGVSAADIARKLGIAEQTFYCWKKQCGGLEPSGGPRAEAASRGERQAQAPWWPT